VGVLGTTLIVTIVFIDTADAHSVRAPPTDGVSPVRSTIPKAAGWILDSAYSVLGPPYFTVGLMLFGLATMALAGFPQGGALLVLGAALALSGCPFSYVWRMRSLFGRGAYIFFVLGTVGAHRSRFCVVGFSALVRRAQKKSIPEQPVVPAS
jgi:hypothetical protein